MSNRRFEMYQYRHIIHRMRMGETNRAIGRTGEMGRIKCAEVRSIAKDRGWLDSNMPLPDDETLAASLDIPSSPNPTHQSLSRPFEDQIRQWVEDKVHMTTIHEALVEQFGFQGSYSSVRRMVQQLGLRQPKATCILDFAPGEAAQVDFGKGPVIVDACTGKEHRTWIFVMTLCFSRHFYAEIVTDQKLSTWLSTHRRAFEWFNGVPAKLVIDNPKCAITKACFRDPEVQRSYGELAEGYGFLISPCPPGEPQMKGRVEAGVKYIKNHFVPLRTFRSLTDANGQLHRWILERAGNRIHGTTRQKPLTLFAQSEKHLLGKLPDVPVELAVWCRVKLHGNCHVQFEKCSYSAPFPLIRQTLWLKATDATVKIYHDLKLVAVHPRLTRPGDRSTVDEHLPPEAIAYKLQDPQWCLRQAESIGPACHRVINHLFSDRVLDNLRAAQGIVKLEKKYGQARLEAACGRVLFFDDRPRYKTVKLILEKGLEQHPLPILPTQHESPVYAGSGRFLRHGDSACAN